MSDVSDNCRVQVLIADFASADAAGKLNILGGGIQLVGAQFIAVAGLPRAGTTAPIAVVASIEVPPAQYDEDYAFELTLFNDVDEIVQHEDPVTGQANAIRIGQVMTATRPQPAIQAGIRFPRGATWSRQQFIANFQQGLPLEPGRGYSWRVSIDGEQAPHWRAEFYVPGMTPPPVAG